MKIRADGGDMDSGEEDGERRWTAHRVRVRRIGVGSLFLVCFVLAAAVGLVVGGGLVLLGTLEVGREAQPTVLDGLGLWALVAIPLGYGLLAGLSGAAAAVLYNAAAALTGGIRFRLEAREKEDAPYGSGS